MNSRLQLQRQKLASFCLNMARLLQPTRYVLLKTFYSIFVDHENIVLGALCGESRVHYNTKVSTSPEEGMAVILREFLQTLECQGIQQNSEKELCKLFCKQPWCATSGKQFFVTKGPRKHHSGEGITHTVPTSGLCSCWIVWDYERYIVIGNNVCHTVVYSVVRAHA